MTEMTLPGRHRPLPRLLAIGALAGSLLCWSGGADAKAPPESFADLAARVSPAVVNIAVAHEAAPAPAEAPRPPLAPPGSPFEEFFERFRGPSGGPEPRRQVGLGSGFVIDPAGYIVTNNHVVDGAREVRVRFGDEPALAAEVVGVDPQTDLALLKVEAERPLPAVSFGNSDAAQVGDWVLAVGNPFGLGGSVTAGIVSARGRNIDAGPYDDFLQVDASINKGNSGGPLFNLDGQVIGVNTAIFSPNGGSVGIGFAIPSNLAKSVIDQLREKGRVERGWLGVAIQNVSPEIASSLGLEEAGGAMIAEVKPGGPAAEGGLRRGDVVLAVDGERVPDSRALARLVAAHPAGSRVALDIWRDGRDRQLAVVTGAQPTRLEVAANAPGPAPDDAFRSDSLGVELAVLTDPWRRALNIGPDVHGVVVLDLDRGDAFGPSLRRGDVIVEIGDVRVDTPRRVEALVRRARLDASARGGDAALLLLINRRGHELFLGLKLGRA